MASRERDRSQRSRSFKTVGQQRSRIRRCRGCRGPKQAQVAVRDTCIYFGKGGLYYLYAGSNICKRKFVRMRAGSSERSLRYHSRSHTAPLRLRRTVTV